MQIGDRIALRRKELGMTQTELAQKMGYKSKAAISKIETNVNNITQSTVVKFAEALDTTIAYLMGWDTAEGIDAYGNRKATEDSKRPISEDDIKAAFWGGERDLSQEEIDDLWADAKDYIAYKTAQRKKKKK